ncbi:DUF4230 domain-containing protein [Riemerella anatipestifer]|uniref:DUF4230 domain-containing protein n=1 Tax=Riemerella anatipestifer TaxID=34085 RepID=UPI000D692AFC|nr:DUF4230 domain-containing protein [Riemerella anatipestifer]MRM86001.1 DUF4230 domain-containing protein [Riemerella anatipestifer]WPC10999.1 DUF4230 domain-containing protein [Riemerella anatipestifer]WPC13346.1 DUF4230 domain-containing protein [Riemerella anatipestifer]WPC14859.1 DUF4230 domain-containing protein [Riemerella anatipestifer]
MKNIKVIIRFVGGVLVMLLIFFVWKGFTTKKGDKIISDYYLINNQISKMNKMVVMEQNFSSMQKTTIKSELLGSSLLPSTEKKIITFTKTMAQVSYDLTKMKIEVDSTDKKLIIKELPQPQVKIIPSVEIQSLDDSFFDRFDEKDIKKITQNAKDEAYKRVNQEDLKKQGAKQLMTNLNEIFVLAKALKYEIVDETKKIPLEGY